LRGLPEKGSFSFGEAMPREGFSQSALAAGYLSRRGERLNKRILNVKKVYFLAVFGVAENCCKWRNNKSTSKNLRYSI
jgi:hypothetical protein